MDPQPRGAKQVASEECDSVVSPTPPVSPVTLRILDPSNIRKQFKHIFQRAESIKNRPEKSNGLKEYKATIHPSYITCSTENLREYITTCLVEMAKLLDVEKPLQNLGPNRVIEGTTLYEFYNDPKYTKEFLLERISVKGGTLSKHGEEVVVRIFQLSDSMECLQEASDLLVEYEEAQMQYQLDLKKYHGNKSIGEIPKEPMRPHVGYFLNLELFLFFRYMADLIEIYERNKDECDQRNPECKECDWNCNC
ncbi:unnamed protein product [Orchesella dallaii]|uniref:Uncharacterized protein n=1 Tax=Orchesella dallaii TaxID=48710 RepID=A0ABP1RS08_9HEXA